MKVRRNVALLRIGRALTDLPRQPVDPNRCHIRSRHGIGAETQQSITGKLEGCSYPRIPSAPIYEVLSSGSCHLGPDATVHGINDDFRLD